MEKRILVGADPIGKGLKDAVCVYLQKEGIEITDVGSKGDVDIDYTLVGDEVARRIANHEFERALLFCGTGMGVNIVANKHEGVYCGLCESVLSARLCRVINNCNVLSMGALITTPYQANLMVKAFLDTAFASDFELAEEAFLRQAFVDVQEIEAKLYHDCTSQ